MWDGFGPLFFGGGVRKMLKLTCFWLIIMGVRNCVEFWLAVWFLLSFEQIFNRWGCMNIYLLLYFIHQPPKKLSQNIFCVSKWERKNPESFPEKLSFTLAYILNYCTQLVQMNCTSVQTHRHFFYVYRECFWATWGWLRTALEKFRESAMAFMADLMGPICQISPGTFLESCSQLASTGAKTSSQRGKLTLFAIPHGEGKGIILYKIS